MSEDIDATGQFWLAFRFTGISDHCMSRTTGVIVTSLGIPPCARDDVWCTREHLEGTANSLRERSIRMK